MTVMETERIVEGSSPRARGAPGLGVGAGTRAGIIPACAGSTQGRKPCLHLSWDHPRVRGEHSMPRLTASSEKGIIPACAGSTEDRLHQWHRRGDHPRVRGEHTRRSSHDTSRSGSSPRARGAPLRRLSLLAARGIIPACAGSTWWYHKLVRPVGDHPRVRGEHRSPSRFGRCQKGSSPRARGAPRRCQQRLRQAGIIPACAGSTGSPPPTRGTTRDHPRVRGEHSSVKR